VKDSPQSRKESELNCLLRLKVPFEYKRNRKEGKNITIMYLGKVSFCGGDKLR